MKADGAAIRVRDLVRSFRISRRRLGVLGALADLVARRRELVRAVDGVSFDVAPGEIVGYIGPNGAGKSTTVKVLCGILVPDAGEVLVDGQVPWRDRRRYTRGIGVVFGQRTQLWWDIAVEESFRLLKRIYGVSDADYAARMAMFERLMGLDEYRRVPVRNLSLGQRMRCDLAAALLHAPRVLFLDEPSIGLDVVAQEAVREFVRRARDEVGTTVVLSTHDLDDIEALCDRILVIDHGRLIYEGTVDGLKARTGDEVVVTADLREALEASRLREALGPEVAVEGLAPLRFRLRFSRARLTVAEVLRRVMDRFPVHDLGVKEASIEDVVKRIYREGIGASAPGGRPQERETTHG